MKRSNKKLEFKTQTVRSLVARDFERVVGGGDGPILTAPSGGGPQRCTTTWSGCGNNDTVACISLPGPGGGGYNISRFTC